MIFFSHKIRRGVVQKMSKTKLNKRTFRKKNEIYKPQTLSCPYCGGKAILRPVSYLFGDHVNEGSSEHYYVCNDYPACNTYIQCRKDTFAPNGTLADGWLRHRRNVAHRYIKIIVAHGLMTQSGIYYLIASRLGIKESQAHIRYSNDYNIEKFIGILREVLDNHSIEYSVEMIESSEYVELRRKGELWKTIMGDNQFKNPIKEEGESCQSRRSKKAC